MQRLFEHSAARSWLCTISLVAWGCAGGVDSLGDVAERTRYRVVVAPLNLAFPLPMELDGERNQVLTEILRYYLEEDAHVAIVAEPDATYLWRESAAAAPGRDDRERIDAAARSFVRSLEAYADFDLVVLPALVHREVRLREDLARWDGVQRRLRVRGRSTPGSRTMLIWNKNISALSLYVLFVTRKGGKVSEGWGGISLLQEAVLGPGGAEDARLLPSRRAVSRPSYVREGVARALASAPLP